MSGELVQVLFHFSLISVGADPKFMFYYFIAATLVDLCLRSRCRP
jgi:hypothetical protein